MKILIVYDSLYGNTGKIAQAIAATFTGSQLQLKMVNQVSAADLTALDLLIAGSPTHGGRPSLAMKQFLGTIVPGSLKHCKAAVFCTALAPDRQGWFTRIIIKLFGYADKHLARTLGQRGATLCGAETFFVITKKGPLQEGQLARAAQWIYKIRQENKIR